MLEKEIHIVKVLKEIRVLKGLLKEQITKAQWQTGYVKYSIKSIEKEEKVFDRRG